MGNIMNSHNHREISLLCKMYKIITGIILSIKNPYSYDIIYDYQYGFIEFKSTISHILPLKGREALLF